MNEDVCEVVTEDVTLDVCEDEGEVEVGDVVGVVVCVIVRELVADVDCELVALVVPVEVIEPKVGSNYLTYITTNNLLVSVYDCVEVIVEVMDSVAVVV